MRIATAIISILMSIFVFFQTMLVGGLSDAVGDEASSSSAAGGVLGALMWLISGALVIAFPAFSMVVYGLASLAFFSGAANFPDLGVYGAFSLLFTLMSFIEWRGKKKTDKKKSEQEELMKRFLEQQTTGAAD